MNRRQKIRSQKKNKIKNFHATEQNIKFIRSKKPKEIKEIHILAFQQVGKQSKVPIYMCHDVNKPG